MGHSGTVKQGIVFQNEHGRGSFLLFLQFGRISFTTRGRSGGGTRHGGQFLPQFDVTQSTSDFARPHRFGHGTGNMTVPFGITAGIPRRGDLRDRRGRGRNAIDGVEAFYGCQQRMSNLATQRLLQMLLEGFPTIGTAFEIDAADTSDRVF